MPINPLNALATALLVASIAARADAQQQALPHHEVVVGYDSGWIDAASGGRPTLRFTVEAADAAWLRLRFATAALGAAPADGRPTRLRLTSRRDGAVQWLDATSLARWSHTSAYFNGEAVVVELFADAGAASSRIAIDTAMAGAAGGGAASICGADDDRVPSDDPRMARLLPTGCTVWMIDDEQHCFLTAGHCGLGASSVVQFNVPLSDDEGNVQHPGPQDQYAVDLESVRSSNTGIGDDWAYFGCFPNADTGLSPFVAQGAAVELSMPAEDAGVVVRITGYGADDSPPQWDNVQQTHDGPLTRTESAILQYQVDTRSGNSGGAVVDESTGRAIGIHTNGGCDADGGANRGTAMSNSGLQAALLSPLGVCRPTPSITFSFPDGLPDPVHPDGVTFAVDLSGSTAGVPVPGSGSLHLDAGAGFQTLPMLRLGPSSYEAVIPPLPCGTAIGYYLSVESTDGQTVTSPTEGAALPYVTVVAAAYDDLFTDDFQSDEGWTVVNEPALQQGAWERGMPEGGGDRGDPPFDADGSGACYVTGLADGNNDVDGGGTSLVSPALDASQGDAHLKYARWFSNTTGSALSEDVLLVELSPDDGRTWTTVDVVGPGGSEADGGWVERSIRVADHVEPTTLLRVRFTASDTGDPSVIEAGVDAVRLTRSADGLLCTTCTADVNSDGVVDVDDLADVLLSWGPCAGPCPPDVNGDQVVDVDDLTQLLLSWGGCS